MPLALFDEIDFLLNKNAPKKTVFLVRECAYRRLLKEVPRQLPDQLPRNKNCNLSVEILQSRLKRIPVVVPRQPQGSHLCRLRSLWFLVLTWYVGVRDDPE